MVTLQLILQIILILLGVYLAFVKSYFSEHGKQLALREHVEELTRKIESVKSEIDLITKTKFDLVVNKRTAILDFHRNYTDWRNNVMLISPSVVTKENYFSYESMFDEVRAKNLIFRNSVNRAILFVENQEFREFSTSVTLACMEVLFSTENYVAEMAGVCIKYDHQLKSADLSEYLKINNDFLKERKEVNERFRKNQLALFSDLVEKEKTLDAYIRQVLYSEEIP